MVYIDITTLNIELNERYKKKKIYTFIGDILIAINPFKHINIYDIEHHEYYYSNTNKNTTTSKQIPPHIFWTANEAYIRMCASKRLQCIVISGESGSGKTESTKLIVQHIIYLCSSTTTTTHSKTNIIQNELQTKILDVNYLLEAFGNAQTSMNSNSSRFGKYLKMNFTLDGNIVGAKIYDYLLEKSRVVAHGVGERNYHIFYYLFHGLSKKELNFYYLESPHFHRILYTNGTDTTSCINITFNDIKEIKRCQDMYLRLVDIMKRIGFTDQVLLLLF